MSDKKDQNSDIDFTSNASFQKSIKKAKWKQLLLYTMITIVTMSVSIFVIHDGSQHLMNKKLRSIESPIEQVFTKGYAQGAGISSSYTRYDYDLFSVTGKTTLFKKIGNRTIVWDTVTKKYPAIGDIEVIDRGSGMSEVIKMDEEAQRSVRYNQLNNERIIDFYYPGLNYDYLPHELKIATGLDENSLAEVALSFNKPMTQKELGEKLGYKNVDWLWTNKKTKEEMDQVAAQPWKVKRGDAANGFGVSERSPYTDYQGKNLTVSGAVVSGTPEELKRFLGMKFVRASTLGVTIDKY
ncbi:anti sigma factor C-terminal domain-containing protein [Virgibacillus flavescens]|uniref:anti sigma factor C-terminal domain-containing protein n=1 Tax=Virgibacillus flavescens TaxID=1611422 RepID=UPI003D3277DC